MYYISFRECKLWYLYVRKTHGWKQEQFITIKVTRKVIEIYHFINKIGLFLRFSMTGM